MEITESSYPVFCAGRIFGYAPFKIRRNKSGRVVHIRRSRALCGYSLSVIGVLVTMCVFGLIRDATSSKPLRMKSTTSKLCMFLDVNMVAGACLLGILAGVFGHRHVLDMNRRLNEIDEMLSAYVGDVIRLDRKALRLFVFVTYVIIMVLLLGVDIYGWYKNAIKYELRNPGVAFVPKLAWYSPFYTLYIFMAILQVQYAQAALGLGKRYRWLNVSLQNLLEKEKSFVFTSTLAIQPLAGGYNFHTRSQKHRRALRNHETINRFAQIHESLGKSMRSMSSAFGLTVLILLCSCLMHLVVTAYFFVLELLGERDLFFSTLQCMWLAFHFLRLLMIVEPCHFTSVESSRTLKIVSKMMRSRTQLVALRSFWRQLLADESYFSACGICRIDRQLLTTFTGGIATYLVILLQFELADGPVGFASVVNTVRGNQTLTSNWMAGTKRPK